MTASAYKISLSMVLAAMIVLLPTELWAAGNDPFAALCSRVNSAWVEGRKIAYIIGGIGTLSLGVMAFFGRFAWSKFFAMLGGLFIISFFSEIMIFVGTGPTGMSNGSGCSGGFNADGMGPQAP